MSHARTGAVNASSSYFVNVFWSCTIRRGAGFPLQSAVVRPSTNDEISNG